MGISIFELLDFITVILYFLMPDSLILTIILSLYLFAGVFGLIVGWYEGDFDWQDIINALVGLYVFFKELPHSKMYYNIIMIALGIKAIYNMVKEGIILD